MLAQHSARQQHPTAGKSGGGGGNMMGIPGALSEKDILQSVLPDNTSQYATTLHKYQLFQQWIGTVVTVNPFFFGT